MGINLAIPGLLIQSVIHYIPAAPNILKSVLLSIKLRRPTDKTEGWSKPMNMYFAYALSTVSESHKSYNDGTFGCFVTALQ